MDQQECANNGMNIEYREMHSTYQPVRPTILHANRVDLNNHDRVFVYHPNGMKRSPH